MTSMPAFNAITRHVGSIALVPTIDEAQSIGIWPQVPFALS